MKPRHSNYPINKLLSKVIEQSGVTPQIFFAELGFKNFPKAVESLDRWLIRGDGNPLLLEKLQSSRFAVDSGRLEAATTENALMLERERHAKADRQEREARKAFVPHIEVITEWLRPAQITLFCISGGNRRYCPPLPIDLTARSLEDQLSYIKRVVTENFAQHNGRTFFNGRITGYLYHHSFDGEAIQLRMSGDVDMQRGAFSRGTAQYRFL